jgi:ectoine hydroxylase-related dioxygenase (phytanoyl-CoA dioxygenase family)
MSSSAPVYQESYESDGFVLVRNLMTSGEATTMFEECLAAVRGDITVPTWPEYTAMAEGVPPAQAPARTRGEHLFTQLAHPSRSPALRHWRHHACYQRAFAIARTLCPVRGLFFSYDQCFYKPGGSLAIVYPHQDGAYWRRVGITCWIALSEVTAEAAPVEYYPGTHHQLWPHVPAPKAWNDMKDLTVDPTVLTAMAIEPVTFVLRPGDCVLHSGLTVHGSGPNTGARPRCGLALHYETPLAIQ